MGLDARLSSLNCPQVLEGRRECKGSQLRRKELMSLTVDEAVRTQKSQRSTSQSGSGDRSKRRR